MNNGKIKTGRKFKKLSGTELLLSENLPKYAAITLSKENLFLLKVAFKPVRGKTRMALNITLQKLLPIICKCLIPKVRTKQVNHLPILRLKASIMVARR